MITEDQLEQLAISWFQITGWGYAHPASCAGQAPPDIVPDGPAPKRMTYTGSALRKATPRGVALLFCLALFTVAVHCQCTATAPWSGTDECPGAITLNTNYGADVDSVHWSWSPSTATMVNASAFDPVFIPDPLTGDELYTLTVELFENGVPCVPASVPFSITVQQVTLPGLGAVFNGSELDPVTTYGPDFPVFAVCDDPPPSSATIDFTDASTGGPPAPGVIDWGNGSVLPLPCTQTYTQELDTITYTTTDPESGCVMTSQFGVLLGGPVELDVSINLTGSLEQCLGDLTTVEIIDPVGTNPANPQGTMYVITYGNGALGFDTIFGTLPAQADFSFQTMSCGEFLAPPNNGNGYTVNVYPYYGCPVTNVVTVNSDAPVYVSEPPVADVSVSPVGPYCTNENIVFTDQSTGDWIDYIPPFTANCEEPNGYWTLSGVQGTDWTLVNGSLGDATIPGSSTIEVEYLVAGNYVVTLYAESNPLCGLDNEQIDICVETPPVADFDLVPLPVSQCYDGNPIALGTDDESSPNATCSAFGYLWDLQGTDICGTASSIAFVDPVNGPTSTEPAITVGGPGDYTITLLVSNAGCGDDDVAVDFSIYAAPSIAPIPPQVLCDGDELEVTASVQSCGPGAATVTWVYDVGGVQTTSPGTTLGPLTVDVPQDIDVTVVSGSCPATTTTFAVSAGTSPGSANAGALSLAPCLNDQLSLLADDITDATYSWTGPDAFTSTDQNPILATWSPGTYSVTASIGPCVGPSSDVIVVGVDTPMVVIGPDSSFCTIGSAFTLSATPAGGLWTAVAGILNAAGIFDPSAAPLGSPVQCCYSFTDPNTNCTGQACRYITVVAPPIAVVNDTTACTGILMQFPNLSEGGSAWSWDFGDGPPLGSGPTPSHDYQQIGTYIVTLTVTAGPDCADTTDATVVVMNTDPIIDFTFTPPNGCDDLAVDFTNISSDQADIDFAWDYGNGMTSVGDTPLADVPYPAAADQDTLYTITLSATWPCGSVTVQHQLEVFASPSVSVVVSNNNGCDTIASVLIMAQGPVDSFAITFGDGTDTTWIAAADTVLLFHDYPLGAVDTSYALIVSAVNVPCPPAIAQVVVQLLVDSLSSSLTAIPPSGCEDLQVNFIAETTGAQSHLWYFGDGTGFVTGANPEHLFVDAGIYWVGHTLFGCSSQLEDSVRVEVWEGPNVDSVSISQVGCTGQPMVCTALDMDLANAQWLVPGMGWVAGTSVVFTPDSTGEYDILFTAMTNDGRACVDTAHWTIQVHDTQYGTIVLDTLNACEPALIDLIGSGPVGALYHWHVDPFGDYNGSSHRLPFNTAGTFNVFLTTTDANGCVSHDTTQVVIHPTPVADYTIQVISNSPEFLTVQFINQSTGQDQNLWRFDGSATSADTSEVQHQYNKTPGACSFPSKLVVSTIFGCADSLETPITLDGELLFFAPNAFTPDGSGLNEKFFVSGPGLDAGNFELWIFDRWGSAIFRTTDPYQGWDGYCGSEICKQDVYVYRVKARTACPKEYTAEVFGHVTLLK